MKERIGETSINNHILVMLTGKQMAITASSLKDKEKSNNLFIICYEVVWLHFFELLYWKNIKL